MRTEIAKLHNRIGTTTIYVTHDQTEAMTMADRIVVLKDGIVQQIDHPQQMYDHPNNIFVAGFIGSPAMNFIRAHLERSDGGYEADFGNTRIKLTRESVREHQDVGEYVGKEVILGIRPENMEDAKLMEITAESDCITVTPEVIESMGSEKYLYFEVPREVAAHLDSLGEMTDDETSGDENGGGSADESGDLMVARVAAESDAKEGQKRRVVIDGSKVQLFDPETEKAIF
jgi:multiple sugar transport system ATP-binding protein